MNLSPMELGIIAIIVLLLFGAKRLPEIARSCGESVREFKKALSATERDETKKGDQPPVA